MNATTPQPECLTRQRKITLHLACLSEHRSRGTLRPEFCSFYWSGIRRELNKEAGAQR